MKRVHWEVARFACEQVGTMRWVSDNEREANPDGLALALTLSNEQLRPALELAFAVAVAGQRLKPPIVAPAQLKRFLNFQKLPTNALATVRKVVEADSVFRDRVATVATDELATELGSVWLRQADGWQERATKLIALATEADDRDDQEREDRSVQRRLTLAEAALTKSRAELAVANTEVERERSRRLEAETTAAASSKHIAAAVAEAKSAHGEATRLKEHLATSQVRIDQLVGERDRARQDLAAVRRSLDDALAAGVQATERAVAAETLLRQRDAEVASHRSATPKSVPVPRRHGGSIARSRLGARPYV
jgi:hypothetical protein